MYRQWKSVLVKVDLFSGITENAIESLMGCLNPTLSKYQKNENLTIAGERYHGLGIILAGEILVTKENEAGNRVILAKLQAGHIFGEMIAFSDVNVWPATVVALEDCVVMFIEPSKIIGTCQQVCASHTQLIMNLLAIISKKALLLNRKLEYLAIKGMREKIATFLLEQYKWMGKTTFMIALNRNELADFLNVSRPSMSRELAKMKDEAIIDYYKSTFKITNMDLLRECIS